MILATSHLSMTSGYPRRRCWNTWIPRTEGNTLLLRFSCLYGGWWKLPDTPPPVFVFTSGYCGGPEWAERIAFNSKPIRMRHFCCARPPPSISSLGRLSRTDDVTTAVNTVSMETPTTALAYISGALPPFSNAPLTSHTLRPLLATRPISPLV